MDSPSNTAGFKKSPFNWMAWFSLSAPLITFGLIFLLSPISPVYGLVGNAAGDFLLFAFCFQVAGLLAGIASLFGIPKYGVKPILWKALFGILAGIAMGFLIFVCAIGAALGHNC